MRLGFGSMTLLLAGLLSTAAGCDTIKELLENGERVFSNAEPSAANETPAPPPAASVAEPAESEDEPESESMPEPVPDAEPANLDSIQRFEDETTIPNADRSGMLRDKLTKIQTAPGSGTLVAALGHGTEVERLALREGYTLVRFENPEQASQKLVGWLLTRTLAEPIECGPGLTAAYVDDEQTCGILCDADADCPRGDDCSQAASRVTGARDDAPIRLCAPRERERESARADLEGPTKPQKDPAPKPQAVDPVAAQQATTIHDGAASANGNAQGGGASQPQPRRTQ